MNPLFETIHDEYCKKLLEIVEKVAPSPASVLITGETGVGKELFAEAIYQMSSRSDKKFIRVNCAAIPDTLMESELFGHEKGLFTGAHKTKIGKFEEANEGTIFLDEIGDLSDLSQAKILRALSEHSIERVGATESIHIDARVISATNRNLRQKISKGEFRLDLFHRLNTIELNIPPLRERREDIIPITKHLLKMAYDYGEKIIDISNSAKKSFLSYDWPGNVRELKNTIERGILLYEGNSGILDINDFNIEKNKSYIRENFDIESFCDFAFNVIRPELHKDDKLINALDRILWEKALERANNHQHKAADLMNVSRRVANYRVNKIHGIPYERPTRYNKDS